LNLAYRCHARRLPLEPCPVNTLAKRVFAVNSVLPH
jgi:hypothetical protein